MKCPKCSIYMDQKSYNGFDVNWCYQCFGVWVNYKILLEMLGQTLLQSEFEQVMNNTIEDSNYEKSKKCPSCKDNYLKEIVFRSYVLDFCVECKGIYFDSGELRKTFPYINNPLQGLSDEDKLWDQTIESERAMQDNPFFNAIMRFAARISGSAN